LTVLCSRKHFRSFHPLVFFVLFLLAFFSVAHRFSGHRPSSSVAAVNENEYADIGVAYVYDGDTVRLENGQKVRFVGIDTPESSENKKLFRDAARSGQDIKTILAMGRAAAVYTKSLLDGRRVRLEFDIEKRDKYGRLLAYVYRADDGLFINEDIIKNGYAYPMTIPPNIRHADEFKKLFHEAQKAGRGLWSD
jgi:micrococcal nuclease